MAATIRDITRLTGLSVATVSKYLNGGHVLPENKILIKNAIQELHYEVNEIARGLATSRTKTVGMLIPTLKNAFACTITAYVGECLRSHGYGTIVCDCRGATEEQVLSFLLSKRVDGIITIPVSGSADHMALTRNRNFPVVLIDKAFQGLAYDCVMADNTAASHKAMSLLISRGHRRIGIICGTKASFSANERLQGYRDELAAQGIAYDERLVMRGEFIVAHGYESFKRLYSLPERPTALYLTNYEITLGAVIAMNELGVRLPQDLSVIGFDNLMFAQAISRRLWMVVQPMREIAETAAGILLGRMEGSLKEPKEIRRLKTTLLEGESIGSIAP